jgi:hypothetical protein
VNQACFGQAGARASNHISKAVRQSTEIVYDAKWSIFVNWCVGREIDPIKVSVQQLADLFVHLFEDKGGRRSGLAHERGSRSVNQACFGQAGAREGIRKRTFLSKRLTLRRQRMLEDLELERKYFCQSIQPHI